MRGVLVLSLILAACGGEDDDSPPPVNAVSAPTAPTVTVHATSTPPGARVTGGGRQLGVTPLSTSVPISAPTHGGAPAVFAFVFELDGYQPATVQAAPIEGAVSVSAALSPMAPPPSVEPAEVAAEPAARGPAAPAEDPNPFRTGQAWRGTYVCAQGRTNLVLRITAVRGNRVEATFDFDYRPQSVTGAYRMAGNYQPPNRHLTLRAGSWIRRPTGYVTVNMSGTVSANGRVYSGRITGAPGCTTFRVAL